jgi:hypothetical protein
MNILFGKPISVDNNNFQVFQEIFDSLQNQDFHYFFNEKIPESPTEFFLSMYSLKDTFFDYLESDEISNGNPKKLSVRKGLFHLFWKNQSDFENSQTISQLSQEQIKNVIFF